MNSDPEHWLMFFPFISQEEEFEESEASESDFNPFGSDSESDLEDPWEKRGGGGGKKGGGGKRRGKPKATKEKKADPFAHLVLGRKDPVNGMRSVPPDTSRVERAVIMKAVLWIRIDFVWIRILVLMSIRIRIRHKFSEFS